MNIIELVEVNSACEWLKGEEIGIDNERRKILRFSWKPTKLASITKDDGNMLFPVDEVAVMVEMGDGGMIETTSGLAPLWRLAALVGQGGVELCGA